MALKFYNTLTKKKEEFKPINIQGVRMYSCGPTVNNYAHIGNLRAYVFADILEKTLQYYGYNVERVMNITDIGILSSDADTGEDKMTMALLRERKKLTLDNMRELAEFYTEKFKEDLIKLNIRVPIHVHFASDYVKEDIELVKKLEDKKYTYKTSDGIYFNISKMSDYGILTGGKKKWQKENARINENPEKKNPEDFALWKFNSELGFESPFGKGFPGWHIECSAIGMKFLGEQFDIHTGGIDLIPTHHTNEIAQSECATGKKPFVQFWMHNEFVDVSGMKMAKSAGNFLRMRSIVDKNIDPLAYRFWLLMASYRTKVNFSWEALEGAETSLKRLYKLYIELGEKTGKVNILYRQKFKKHLENDLDTPKTLSLLWNMMKDKKISDGDKKATILDFDKVLGLGLEKVWEESSKIEEIPEEINKLAEERKQARINKDFKKSDELRKKINSLGYEIKDAEEKYSINPVRNSHEVLNSNNI